MAFKISHASTTPLHESCAKEYWHGCSTLPTLNTSGPATGVARQAERSGRGGGGGAAVSEAESISAGRHAGPDSEGAHGGPRGLAEHAGFGQVRLCFARLRARLSVHELLAHLRRSSERVRWGGGQRAVGARTLRTVCSPREGRACFMSTLMARCFASRKAAAHSWRSRAVAKRRWYSLRSMTSTSMRASSSEGWMEQASTGIGDPFGRDACTEAGRISTATAPPGGQPHERERCSRSGMRISKGTRRPRR